MENYQLDLTHDDLEELLKRIMNVVNENQGWMYACHLQTKIYDIIKDFQLEKKYGPMIPIKLINGDAKHE